MELFPRIAAALLPVILFLLVLLALDGYRLVRPTGVFHAVAWGCMAAALAYLVNGRLISSSGYPQSLYAIYWAPLVEEALKAAYLVWLLRRRHLGFLVDAAIVGFAVGAGFALVENTYYLSSLDAGSMLLWWVRGLGTALMHGGTTAIVAILGRLATEHTGSTRLAVFLPGFATAVAVHGFFNAFMHEPVVTVGIVLVVLPLATLAVYAIGERRLQLWLGHGFDRDVALLAQIQAGEVANSSLGRYLDSLRVVFPGEALADMLCIVRLQAELSMRARGQLVMRHQGFEAPIEEETRRKFTELRTLEKKIGRAGRFVLRPLSRWSQGEDWERHLLER